MEDIQFENEVDNKVFDIIVVGAGVAGSAFAYSLGKAGKRVLCIERDLSEPDRIVGELMQPGGVRALRELGMEGNIIFFCFFYFKFSHLHSHTLKTNTL